jgi:hypothetical protein
MNLTGDPVLAGQQIFSSSATQLHALGARMVTTDGRVFRYAQAGASALVVGNCLQAPAQITNHQQLTPSAAALGATSISVTFGATAAAANLYAGGWAIIDTTPGLGYAYPIKSHPAAAGSDVVILQLENPIQVALTTSSRVSLQINPYKNVIQTPVTTLTGAVVGVCTYPIAAAEYGWIQRSGAAGVLIQGTPAVGHSLSCPASAAGAAAINSTTLPIIGSTMVTGVDGKVQAVMLTLE